MKRNRQEKGITLIALVITVIVLLILAGVAINAITGDNGVMNKTQIAVEETNKAKIKEEIELEIVALQIDKIEITKEDIVKMLETMGGIVLTYDENSIDGEYKDYQIVIDENNEVTIGGKLTGAKPNIDFIVSTTESGVDSVELTVIATTTEGEIKSLESLDGLTPISGADTSEIKYNITKNGKYRFKAVGENNRIRIETKSISNLLQESESLLSAISDINSPGETRVKVLGKIGTEVKEEKYDLDVVYYQGDLNLDGTDKEITGLSYNESVYTCGNSYESEKKTVVLLVDGNLNLANEYTLKSIEGKGFIIYCTKTLTIDGTVNMSGATVTSERSKCIFMEK